MLGKYKSKTDLILALNKMLQKAEEEMQLCKVGYLSSEAVSAFLTKKSNTELIVPRLLNIFIQATKMVDQVIVRVKILKQWQCLKVHSMSLKKYLDKRIIELLKYKIKFSTGIKLKSLPQ